MIVHGMRLAWASAFSPPHQEDLIPHLVLTDPPWPRSSKLRPIAWYQKWRPHLGSSERNGSNVLLTGLLLAFQCGPVLGQGQKWKIGICPRFKYPKKTLHKMMVQRWAWIRPMTPASFPYKVPSLSMSRSRTSRYAENKSTGRVINREYFPSCNNRCPGGSRKRKY